MRYKRDEVRCGTCRFWQRIGADHFCDRLVMTGKSRVKEQKLSTGPYRPCTAWEARTAAEQKQLVEDKRRGAFNVMLEDGYYDVARAISEKRKTKAWEERRREDRGDMAKSLGMSARAAEALYGGEKL